MMVTSKEFRRHFATSVKAKPDEATVKVTLVVNPLRLAKLFAVHWPSTVSPISAGAKYFRPSPKTSPGDDQSGYFFLFLFPWFLVRLFSETAKKRSGRTGGRQATRLKHN